MDIHTLNSFIDYLRVEKGAAANTIAAYRRDLTRYLNWRVNNPESPIKEYAFSLKDLAPSSLERNYSAVRSFHKYLNREFNISDPTDDLPETSLQYWCPSF
jgi:integrase/recombinase XerD